MPPLRSQVVVSGRRAGPAHLRHRPRGQAVARPSASRRLAPRPPIGCRSVTVRDLDRIFKAYDVRGVVPDELDAELAERIGAAFADWTSLPTILIGRDARLSSPELATAIS